MAVSRNELFAGLVLVGFVNGISARAVHSVVENGIAAALLSTFEISVIVWSACAVGISFVLRGPAQPAARFDFILAGVALSAFLVPVAPLSWLALSGLAVHILRTSPRSSFLHRGGWILLAVTVPMFWSRLLFSLASGPILEGDATLVGWLVGTPRIGNAVQFADGSGFVWIAPGCSSLANISLAILCWVTCAKVFDRVGSWRDAGWCLLACAAVASINVTRISLIGLYPEHYELIHGPVGATITSWAILGATVGICLFGVRRGLPGHATQDPPGDLGPGMTLRPALSGLAVLVLAVSLSLKLLITAEDVLTSKSSLNPSETAAVLERDGYEVTGSNTDNDLISVRAVAGRCSIMVAEAAPLGWHRSIIAQLAAGHQLFYIFGGRIYPEQPLVLTSLHHYWNRLRRYVGLTGVNRPVLAVVASPACENVPLQQLAELRQ